MTLIARDQGGGGDFKRLPPGAHFAICDMVVDCGEQMGFKGKPLRKIYIRWEAPDERIEWTDKDGHVKSGPMTVGQFYTLSLSENAYLRKDLENWRGLAFTDAELKGFNVLSVLGKACQLQVTHAESNGKHYANVTGIMGLAKEQKARARTLKAENPLIAFSLDAYDQKVFDALPEWLQKKISDRVGPGAPVASTPIATQDDFDDDIPF